MGCFLTFSGLKIEMLLKNHAFQVLHAIFLLSTAGRWCCHADCPPWSTDSVVKLNSETSSLSGFPPSSLLPAIFYEASHSKGNLDSGHHFIMWELRKVLQSKLRLWSPLQFGLLPLQSTLCDTLAFFILSFFLLYTMAFVQYHHVLRSFTSKWSVNMVVKER